MWTQQPIVIGHRGASGYRPEHTLASYELAARMGADCIEPDLVSTSDGILVARHENEISSTTDVIERPEFVRRRRSKTIDGREVTGWFTEDFTLEEVRSLRAIERLPGLRQQNRVFDGRYQVPTLEEIFALRARLSEELGREVGVYPETKHATHFESLGLGLEKPLVAALETAGLNRADAAVYLQSFELGSLLRLRHDLGVQVPLILLATTSGAPPDLVAAGDDRTYADLLTATSLHKLAADIDGIGPDKRLVIPWRPDGTLGDPTSLVADAHAAGLVVHPWTFRAENVFLPADYRLGGDAANWGRLTEEIESYLMAGVDGFFTDHADLGVAARDGSARSR
ncbi:MAG: glycerophosphodiester phosphodiesterase [Ornithinimicrobium sp.]|uniref:glycerophosphodiester phosphodiesterase n=1 Tax=Ornithinimicrobium sp. TaxID=1977084 RepID=UPI0026DEB20B|nr:glycerophosphodiester phosphodiesterase [Ornithinimicrobium sp.]MDO5739509.1 glycerophosphodiester phosphodiesterase [Ornithinimicrobium sp.]